MGLAGDRHGYSRREHKLMSAPDEPDCPACGTTASDESIRNKRLESLGYLHEDVRYECPNPDCGHTWVHGVPEGSPDSDKWVCDSCGGDYMPHFLFIDLGTQQIECRPKCQNCSHAPETYLTLEDAWHGENVRAFVGHHTVTGNREDADGSPI